MSVDVLSSFLIFFFVLYLQLVLHSYNDTAAWLTSLELYEILGTNVSLKNTSFVYFPILAAVVKESVLHFWIGLIMGIGSLLVMIVIAMFLLFLYRRISHKGNQGMRAERENEKFFFLFTISFCSSVFMLSFLST